MEEYEGVESKETSLCHFNVRHVASPTAPWVVTFPALPAHGLASIFIGIIVYPYGPE
jgi:hypothetical protein